MRFFRLLGAFAIIVLAAQRASAVYELIVIEKPFHARSVSGIVLDPVGQRLAGAEVKDYDSGFTNIRQSTTTDEQGRFSLSRSGQSVHYLRIYARGMNPLQITVVLRPLAKPGIRVKVHIGG